MSNDKLAFNYAKEREAFLGALSGDEDLAGIIGPVARPNTARPTYLSKPTLSIGSTGIAVRELQGILAIAIDGTFGKSTETKLIAFQRELGLPTTGVADPRTWAALLGEKYIGTAAEVEARKAQTQSVITQAQGLLSQFFPQASAAEVSAATAPPEPEKKGWGLTQYALLTGGIVLVGGLGYLAYTQMSKD